MIRVYIENSLLLHALFADVHYLLKIEVEDI